MQKLVKKKCDLEMMIFKIVTEFNKLSAAEETFFNKSFRFVLAEQINLI